MNFKVFLWKMGWIKEDTCPLCKNKLIPHYTYDELGGYCWSCSNCKFGN